MKRPTLKQLRQCETVEDLEALGLKVDYDISHRGGGLGVNGLQVAELLGVDRHLLPGKVGCGCNYLGGGIRGKVYPSNWSNSIEGKFKRTWLSKLTEACMRAYTDMEGEMNEEEIDGETNWDAVATNAARAAGIERAY